MPDENFWMQKSIFSGNYLKVCALQDGKENVNLMTQGNNAFIKPILIKTRIYIYLEFGFLYIHNII